MIRLTELEERLSRLESSDPSPPSQFDMREVVELMALAHAENLRLISALIESGKRHQRTLVALDRLSKLTTRWVRK